MTARATAETADSAPLPSVAPATPGEETPMADRDSWPPPDAEVDELLALSGKGPLAGQVCPLVQLDGRKGGQVTVDESRLPAATVLALFLDGCEVDRVLGMYPHLDETHAAVLHRLAADLSGRAVTVREDEDA